MQELETLKKQRNRFHIMMFIVSVLFVLVVLVAIGFLNTEISANDISSTGIYTSKETTVLEDVFRLSVQFDPSITIIHHFK